MGQKQSCLNRDAVQNVVNKAPDGTSNNKNNQEGNPNLPRLDNPMLAKEPIITQVHRRHKGARLPKQRELMVAGLQVRQQQGESIAYLLNSLPYGSIIQVESNTHLIVAQPVRRLQISICQNHLGNVQIADVTSQEGIVPAQLKKNQILVTVNGQSIKTVDQAVELLSKPEKLLLVIAEAPLDKKDRQQMKGTVRVVDSVLTKRDIKRSNSSLLSSPREQKAEEDEEAREDRRRHHRRRRRHERRGSGSSHGSHGSSKSHGSSRSCGSRSRRSSSSRAEKKSTTPLRNQDKVLPTEAIRRNSNVSGDGSSSMSSSNVDGRGADKIFVSKNGNQLDGSSNTHPTADSSMDHSKLMMNTTMDTANTTVISYDGDDSFMVHSPRIISPNSSVASPTSARQVQSPSAAAMVTPASLASLEHVSKIGSYDDEENDHPLLFQGSSESQDDDVSEKKARAAAMFKTTGEEDTARTGPKVLASLEAYLDETMMELAFVMIEIEDIQAKEDSKPIGDVVASPPQESRMTEEQLNVLEKELRHRVFDILEARQKELEKQQGSIQHRALVLPTIDEQPDVDDKSSSLKEPSSPPPKLSLTPVLETEKKMQDLEQQLLEMQLANKALKQALAQKDSQLEEFQDLKEKQEQNKVLSTRIQ